MYRSQIGPPAHCPPVNADSTVTSSGRLKTCHALSADQKDAHCTTHKAILVIRVAFDFNRKIPVRRRSLLHIDLLAAACQGESIVIIDNPYANHKPYPYKASLHNHTLFNPAYSHAPVPAPDRLKDYRDYVTSPPYGIVAITDHDRLTTPWNTTPPCWKGVYDYSQSEPPWGVDGILWLPGMERILGRRDGSDNELFGEIVCINCRPELLETESKWQKIRSDADRSGWFYHTHESPASAELAFVGSGISWVTRTGPNGCIAKVFIDGNEVAEVDLFSPETRYQQDVFTRQGLPLGMHTIRIVQTAEKNPANTNRFSQHIGLDSFVVRKADGTDVDYGADHTEIRYSPLRHRYDRRPNESARDVLAQLIQDNVYVILAHPNARLETEGEHAGKQIWSSAGYTYEELDVIFGNQELGRLGYPYRPHALEIGNVGYDLTGGARTQWTNAEAKWDYLLTQGHRVHGVASDDSHGRSGRGGWCIVYTNAPTVEELTVEDVMDSLFRGVFYASQGPEISLISVEDDRFMVEADAPATIEFISKGRVVQAESNVRSSCYLIRGDEGYIRARVTRSDPSWRFIDGGVGYTRSAWTNPIYVIG